MLISFAWLRALVPVAADSDEVSRRLTSRGLTVDGVTTHDGDTVFDVDVPANRPDALGHLGVARELAAAFGLPLSVPAQGPAATGEPVHASLFVAIDDATLCGRYTAGIVRGVRVGPSPDWVASRITACGLRPINNVVDVSNLVMLELGQPVHFFDLARIAGSAIHVRASLADERIRTLDGVSRTLAPGMIVIADAEAAVALGGVMGGAESQITETTKDILVEAAWFLPRAVRRTSRTLGMSTDASQRFERGCDPEAPPAAQELAARLLAEIAGGIPAPGIIDVRPVPRAERTLSMRRGRAAALLGYPVAMDEAFRAFLQLGLAPRIRGDGIDVTIPTWRVDLEREVDLVEELARHLGYDRIPSRVPLDGLRSGISSPKLELEENIRDRFAALGFNEAFNYAMIGRADDDAFVPKGSPPQLALSNPISEGLGYLRRSLLPGLMRAVDQNLRRGAYDVRLFEIGSVFGRRAPGAFPDEPTRAAFAWSGGALPAHWSRAPRAVDAWDAAGIIEDLLELAAGGSAFSRDHADLDAFHPGQSLLWRSAHGQRVAWCGPVHPDLTAALDLPAPVWLGEIDLTVALGLESVGPTYRAIARHPAMWRDLSIVLDSSAACGDVVTALMTVPAPARSSMTWIDRYSGPPLLAGQAAMTLRVILQPLERTLTDAEAEAYRAELVLALDEVKGVQLRRIDT